MTRRKIFKYANEAAMCDAYMRWVKEWGWTPYPETGDYDILLAHPSGVQIGIEAKQSLNPHVVCQAAESLWGHGYGPDFRAVLVPEGGTAGLEELAQRLNISVIRCKKEVPADYEKKRYESSTEFFSVALPQIPGHMHWLSDRDWFDLCPAKKIDLPDYVPDTKAGDAAPLKLTHWKIQAIKLVIVLEKRGYVTAADFRMLKIHPSRWQQGGWLTKGELRGQWVPGRLPNFRHQHPTNFVEIEADYEKWSKKELVAA